MQTKKPAPRLLFAATLLLSQAGACRKALPTETQGPSLAAFPPGCQLVVLWEGHAWQREKPRGLLDRLRALPAWQEAWNPRHDAWLEKTAGAAFSLSAQGETPLLFLGKVDDRVVVVPKGPTCQDTQPELARMLLPRNAGTLLRFAAALPPSLREELGRGKVAHAIALAAILRVSGSLDWREKPCLSLRFELSNTPAARELALALEAYRQEAKQHPDLLLLGLGPHLESLSIEAKQAVVSVTLTLANDEAMDLLDELGKQLARKKQP